MSFIYHLISNKFVQIFIKLATLFKNKYYLIRHNKIYKLIIIIILNKIVLDINIHIKYKK